MGWSQPHKLFFLLLELTYIVSLAMTCATTIDLANTTAVLLHVTSNSTSNQSAQAPYFRNVSAGEVWVLPNRRYDIGGRGMSCECFSPDGTRCLTSLDRSERC